MSGYLTFRRAILKVSAALVDELQALSKPIPPSETYCAYLHRLLRLPSSCRVVGWGDQVFFREQALALLVEDPTAFKDVPELATLPLVGAAYFRGPDGLAEWAGWVGDAPTREYLAQQWYADEPVEQESYPPEVALRWQAAMPLPPALENATDEEVARLQKRFEEKFCGRASADTHLGTLGTDCRGQGAGPNPFDRRPEGERWRDG